MKSEGIPRLSPWHASVTRSSDESSYPEAKNRAFTTSTTSHLNGFGHLNLHCTQSDRLCRFLCNIAWLQNGDSRHSRLHRPRDATPSQCKLRRTSILERLLTAAGLAIAAYSLAPRGARDAIQSPSLQSRRQIQASATRAQGHPPSRQIALARAP